MAGHGNRVSVMQDGATLTDFPSAKIFNTRLKKGDGFIVHPGGGGGFGPPWERPPDRVAEDVRQGYVSLESARRDYGVVLVSATLAVDTAATAALRAEMGRA
jgi:N-methylhydantoinase B